MGTYRTNRNKTVKDFFLTHGNLFLDEDEIAGIEDLDLIRTCMEDVKFLQMFVDSQLSFYQTRHGELLRKKFREEQEKKVQD